MSKIGEKEVVEEALRITDEARRGGVTLRIMGGIAVRIHTHYFSSFYEHLTLPRGEGGKLRDIDMVTYKSQSGKAHKLFIDLGYKPDKLVMAYFGESRFMYHHPEGLYNVDLFFENLRFSHEINLGSGGKVGRLELDYPTLTVADLILGKLQIHEITEKDIRDLSVLLREHHLENGDVEDSISLGRIASSLAQDWGFWYDARSNLELVAKSAERYLRDDLIEKEDSNDIAKKVKMILESIDEAPKSKNWLKSEREGDRKKWWEDVEELVR
jgi:hypothetical protein